MANSGLACAVKSRHTQVIFEPTEEQFDLPTRAISPGDYRKRRVPQIGPKYHASVVFLIVETYPPNIPGPMVGNGGANKANRLVGPQGGGSIHRSRGGDVETHIRSGADEKECSRLGHAPQATKIDIPAIPYHRGCPTRPSCCSSPPSYTESLYSEPAKNT